MVGLGVASVRLFERRREDLDGLDGKAFEGVLVGTGGPGRKTGLGLGVGLAFATRLDSGRRLDGRNVSSGSSMGLYVINEILHIDSHVLVKEIHKALLGTGSSLGFGNLGHHAL